MKNLFKNAVGLSKIIRKYVIEKGDTVVDATMGNGHDTLFLSSLVEEEGHVYAFDIQRDALLNTKEKLKKEDVEKRVTLILDGHENIDEHVEYGVKFIIYNLGYLPRGDHNITTKADTTVESIEKGLTLLVPGGMILVVIYPGHRSGMLEKEAIDTFSASLNQKTFSVVSIRFTNQVNNPPEVICIERLCNS